MLRILSRARLIQLDILISAQVALWAMEYGPELREQNGLLSEAVSAVLPKPAAIGQFLAVLISVDGLLMYFATDRYAAFWGYSPLDPISSFCTICEGYSLVMLGAFWRPA